MSTFNRRQIHNTNHALDMSATASETDKHFFMACYSLPRVRSYIPLVVSSPIDIEVMTSPRASLKLDGNADPEFCRYGVRASPVSIASDADTDSLPELRVKATVSSLPVVGASMGDPRSPTSPSQSGPGRRTTTTPTASACFWTTVLMRTFVT